MHKDPLASFRRVQQSDTVEELDRDQARQPYEAYGKADRSPERLEIRRVLGETHAPSYRYLMDVSFNADQGTELVLMYSFMLVKIKGKHMQNLIRAILDSTCLFIQDFHPNEFMSPKQSGAAVIDSIEVVTRKE